MSAPAQRRKRPRRMYTAKYRVSHSANRVVWVVVFALAVVLTVLISIKGW